MRIHVDAPELLPDLCDYLSRRGFLAVEVGAAEAQVALPKAPSEFEAAMLLLADIDLWRAKRAWVHVSLDPSG